MQRALMRLVGDDGRVRDARLGSPRNSRSSMPSVMYLSTVRSPTGEGGGDGGCGGGCGGSGGGLGGGLGGGSGSGGLGGGLGGGDLAAASASAARTAAASVAASVAASAAASASATFRIGPDHGTPRPFRRHSMGSISRPFSTGWTNALAVGGVLLPLSPVLSCVWLTCVRTGLMCRLFIFWCERLPCSSE